MATGTIPNPPTREEFNALNSKFTIKSDSETLTTNANGVVALSKIHPNDSILIAIYVGNGSYGYLRTDSISSNIYGLQVLNMTGNTSPTKVATTQLTFTYNYFALS